MSKQAGGTEAMKFTPGDAVRPKASEAPRMYVESTKMERHRTLGFTETVACIWRDEAGKFRRDVFWAHDLVPADAVVVDQAKPGPSPRALLRVAAFRSGVMPILKPDALNAGDAVLCENEDGWTPAVVLSVDEGTTGKIAIAESPGSMWSLRHGKSGWLVEERMPLLGKAVA